MSLPIKLLTAVFIFNGDRVLLLKRSKTKKFLPGKMVGIGGHVEPGETTDLLLSSLREVEEETKIKRGMLSDFKYLGILSFSDFNGLEGHSYFFSAEINDIKDLDLSCPDGQLNWYPVRQLPKLNFCEDTKKAIPYLLKAKRLRKIFRGNYIFNRRRNCFSYLMG